MNQSCIGDLGAVNEQYLELGQRFPTKR
jgi:hypothetical protein